MKKDGSSQPKDKKEVKCTIKRVNSSHRHMNQKQESRELRKECSSRRKNQKEARDLRKDKDNSCRHNNRRDFTEFKNQSRKATGNFILMMELKKKILIFRDLIDLSPCNGSTSVEQLMIHTMKDLHKLYPETIPCIRRSEMKGLPLHQVVRYFCIILEAVGEPSMLRYDCDSSQHDNFEKQAEIAVTFLDSLIKMAKEKFDMVDEDEGKKDFSSRTKTFGKVLKESYSDNSSFFPSPITPTSVLPEILNGSPRSGHSSPLLLSLRVQAVEKLNPIDVKRLAFHMLPNVDAHQSILNEKNNVVEEQDEEAKSTSELLSSPISDDSRDPSSQNETPIHPISTTPGTSPTCSETEEATESPLTPSKLSIDMELEVISPPSPPSMLPPNVRAAGLPLPPPPPPPPPILQPYMAARRLLPPPTPPPSPLLEPNVYATELSLPPPTPPPSPMLQPWLEEATGLSLPLPPPSPPMSQPNAAGIATTKPLPQLRRSPPVLPSRGQTLPPPPPPPPMASDAAANSGPPTPSPMVPSKGTGTLLQPPSMLAAKENATPPPPPAGRSLRPIKANTKLKRSKHMGNLYRVLKGKMEGKSLPGKSHGRNPSIGNCSAGKQGMADALAEMTKRSAYFQQIEEDVQKYAQLITELKSAIDNFKSKDMAELLEFHQSVESILEHLEDETQVLARFEGFPTKKLEALRTAAALYTRLESIVNELQSLKAEPPLEKLLDKVESYFSKMKIEVDALERIKDEENKKFKSHGIGFDFNALVRIKEATVDVSSNCMELALKERKEAKAEQTEGANIKSEAQKKGCIKHLWRTFQFAFRVYTFAGGIDERAEKLTRELAREIENDPHHNSVM
ncbi:hypothetical protein SLE2022_390800 [Rubroshorea leprosula]